MRLWPHRHPHQHFLPWMRYPVGHGIFRIFLISSSGGRWNDDRCSPNRLGPVAAGYFHLAGFLGPLPASLPLLATPAGKRPAPNCISVAARQKDVRNWFASKFVRGKFLQIKLLNTKRVFHRFSICSSEVDCTICPLHSSQHQIHTNISMASDHITSQ